MMRLEIGSGDRPSEDWTHLDIRPLEGVDIVDDATKLSLVPDGSCDAIRAVHVLEHFGWREIPSILGLWFTKLRPGGKLELEVPNLLGWIRDWACDEVDDAAFVEGLFGEQTYPENFHKVMFTPRTLSYALRDAGFEPVKPIVDAGRAMIAWAHRPEAAA